MKFFQFFMVHVLHLIDSGDVQELRLGLEPLLAKSARSDLQQSVLIVRGNKNDFSYIPAQIVRRLPIRFGIEFLSASALRRYVQENKVDLIHAWGLEIARLAILALEDDKPVAISQWNPILSVLNGRWMGEINRRVTAGVLCHSGMVQRRLVESGMQIERSVLVRPGVDFSRLNQLHKKRLVLRSELGLEADHAVVLMPSPPSVEGGHELGLWAAAIAHRFVPNLKLVLAGVNDQQRKLMRYAQRIPRPPFVITMEDRYSFESLLSIANVLLVPANGDWTTSCLAWAMAASVAIVGCANYCTTEYIADGLNGHLVKPDLPMALAGKLVQVLQSPDNNYAAREQARGQAFETFGLARYTQQVRKCYENLLRGRPVADDIIDSAIDQ